MDAVFNNSCRGPESCQQRQSEFTIALSYGIGVNNRIAVKSLWYSLEVRNRESDLFQYYVNSVREVKLWK